MEKPSLHEIAAMPFPASLNAMRKHYNPNWGKEVPEDGQKRKFKVEIEYAVIRAAEYTVEAFSEDEARQEAEDEFYFDHATPEGAEIESVQITRIEGEA